MVQLRQMNALVDMLADVKYALRRFNKSPGFTATAVVTLALGIGATAAIFTLIQQVMLRSLAVAKPEQLWRIGDAVTMTLKAPDPDTYYLGQRKLTTEIRDLYGELVFPLQATVLLSRQ